MKYYYGNNFANKRKRKSREYAAAEIYTRIISSNNFITNKNVEWRVWKADRSKKYPVYIALSLISQSKLKSTKKLLFCENINSEL